MQSLKIFFMVRLSRHFMTEGDRHGQLHDSARGIPLLDHLTSPANRFKAAFQGHGFRERRGDAARRAGARAGAIVRSCRVALINIPIEIKKSMHRELWSAIRNQLVRKYTRDPGSEGYGVYVVLWFGVQDVPTPPSGLRPQNALELRERLRDGLEADERLKISIVVIDVANPDIGQPAAN